jgi:CheY-like chemotaxis protein
MGNREPGHFAVAVIEDDLEVAGLLAEIVERAGHVARVVYDGEAALRLFADEAAPRVVILDLGLPLADGFAVAEAARQRLGSDVFIIAITGYASAKQQQRAERAGFDALLMKPFALVDMDEALSRAGILQDRRGQRSN